MALNVTPVDQLPQEKKKRNRTFTPEQRAALLAQLAKARANSADARRKKPEQALPHEPTPQPQPEPTPQPQPEQTLPPSPHQPQPVAKRQRKPKHTTEQPQTTTAQPQTTTVQPQTLPQAIPQSTTEPQRKPRQRKPKPHVARNEQAKPKPQATLPPSPHRNEPKDETIFITSIKQMKHLIR